MGASWDVRGCPERVQEAEGVTLDHGHHPHRQERLWVSDFTEEEAMEFLTLRGLGDKTAEFLLRQKLNVLFPSSKVAPRFAKSQKVFVLRFCFFGFAAFRLSVLIFWKSFDFLVSTF